MNDLELDRALYLVSKGMDPCEAIAKAKSAIAAEGGEIVDGKHWHMFAAINGRNPQGSGGVRQAFNSIFPLERKRGYRRPKGIDYGCYSLTVDLIPEDAEIPSGTVKYFGNRMHNGKRKRNGNGRKRKLDTSAAVRPAAPIVKTEAQRFAERNHLTSMHVDDN
jgi:hypothetical protein